MMFLMLLELIFIIMLVQELYRIFCSLAFSAVARLVLVARMDIIGQLHHLLKRALTAYALIRDAYIQLLAILAGTAFHFVAYLNSHRPSAGKPEALVRKLRLSKPNTLFRGIPECGTNYFVSGYSGARQREASTWLFAPVVLRAFNDLKCVILTIFRCASGPEYLIGTTTQLGWEEGM